MCWFGESFQWVFGLGALNTRLQVSWICCDMILRHTKLKISTKFPMNLNQLWSNNQDISGTKLKQTNKHTYIQTFWTMRLLATSCCDVRLLLLSTCLAVILVLYCDVKLVFGLNRKLRPNISDNSASRLMRKQEIVLLGKWNHAEPSQTVSIAYQGV